MSDLLVLADARTRGVDLPAADGVAQDILDETEAWLARQIGQLVGERTERFYVGPSETRGRLGLARYADPESWSVDDGGVTIPDGQVRLIERGAAIVRTYSALTRWWTGPYVDVTYEPADEVEVRRTLYDLVALAAQGAGVLGSVTIGQYSETRSTTTSAAASRAALASALLPRRNPLVTLYASGRRLTNYDPVINRAEPAW
jgi:hypothetical protein